MIPFEPEPIDEARDRFPVALETTYEAWRAASPEWNVPGEKRENIFDFDDGLRLIVSRDILYPFEEPVIHVSASLYEAERWRTRSRKRVERIIRQRLEKLFGGGRVVMGPMWITSGRVPHWTITKDGPET